MAKLRDRGLCDLEVDQVDILYHDSDTTTRYGQVLSSYIICDLI